MIDLDSLKNELRIDGTDDDAYLAELITVAQDVTISAIDSTLTLEQYQAYSQFDRAVKLLVAAWYFNRAAVTDAQHYEQPLSYRMLVGQLRGKLWGDPDVSDT